MKRIAALALLILLTGCASAEKAAPQPQWFEAYADGELTVRAMYASDDFGSGVILFELTNDSPSALTLSSVLGLRVSRYGEPVEVTQISGFDRRLPPGQTARCTLHLACQGAEGCEVSLAADFAAGKWVTVSESRRSPEE